MGKIITYRNEGLKGVFCQVMLNNNERVLISLAGNYIKVLKLVLGGNIPVKSVWKLEIFILQELLRRNDIYEHPLDLLKNKIVDCNSSKDVKIELDQYFNYLVKNAKRG